MSNPPVQICIPSPTHLFVTTLKRPPPLDTEPLVLVHSTLDLQAVPGFLATIFPDDNLRTIEVLCEAIRKQCQQPSSAPLTGSVLSLRLKSGAILTFEAVTLSGGCHA